MFIRLTRPGGHSYLQLVKSFRNEEGKPRQRTVATLGRLDETGGGVDSLLNGLLRAKVSASKVSNLVGATELRTAARTYADISVDNPAFSVRQIGLATM